MNPDDLIDQLETMMQDITPYEKRKLQQILNLQPEPVNDVDTTTASTPVAPEVSGAEPAKGSPEYFAQRREQGAVAAQAAMTDIPPAPEVKSQSRSSIDNITNYGQVKTNAPQAVIPSIPKVSVTTPKEKPAPADLDADRERLLPAYGESKFYSKFLDQKI